MNVVIRIRSDGRKRRMYVNRRKDTGGDGGRTQNALRLHIWRRCCATETDAQVPLTRVNFLLARGVDPERPPRRVLERL